MEKKFKVLITFAVIVLLVAGLYFFTNWFSIVTGYFKGEDDVVKLVSCLNKNGAEFYGSEFCAECVRQQELFGKAFESVNRIECGREKELCPNIREIPALYINKNIYYGFKTIEELKEISGC